MVSVWLSGLGEASPNEMHEFRDHTEACIRVVSRALDDAGLSNADVHGLLVHDAAFVPNAMQAALIAGALGLRPRVAMNVSEGGATPIAAIAYACSLIERGHAENLVIAHADMRRTNAPTGGIVQAMATFLGHPELETPYGPIVATLYALIARRFMAERGIGRTHLDAIADAARQFAAKNPNARRPRPLYEDSRDSQPIAGPLRNCDCCLVTDFASAIVVSKHPGPHPGVYVAGLGGCVTNEQFHHTNFDDVLLGARSTASEVYESARSASAEVDLALLYDSFTVTTLMQIDAYRLDRGMGVARFLEDVGIGPLGFPVNTHGGLLACSTSGLLHVIEAVRQLRHDAGERQVVGARNALVTGVGGVFGMHSAAILRRVDT